MTDTAAPATSGCNRADVLIGSIMLSFYLRGYVSWIAGKARSFQNFGFLVATDFFDTLKHGNIAIWNCDSAKTLKKSINALRYKWDMHLLLSESVHE